jgi:hypothetical protein
MRVVLLTPRAHFRIVPVEDESVVGILIDGNPLKSTEGVSISNFFLPIIGCEFVAIPNFNGDDFTLCSQVSMFKSELGGIYLGPSEEHNDMAICIAEFKDIESFVLPKFKSPVLVKKLEFDEVRDDIYIMILVRDTSSTLFAFNTNDEVIEHEFYYNYLEGYVGHKCKKLPNV